jgi:4-amino-4-deoxy-L-arabinose transferase-like glycosyltransferase
MADLPADNRPPGFAPIFPILVAVGVGIRLIALMLAGELEPHADESGYLYLAMCLNYFGLFADSGNFLWPPGYPWFLSLCLRWFGYDGIFAAKLIQVLASGVVGACTIWIAARCWGRAAGVIAGILWCVYLPLIGYTHYLWPEITFLALFLPAMCLFISAWSDSAGSLGPTVRLLICGLLMGLSLLIKESVLYLPAILCAMVLWASRRRPLIALNRAAVLLLAIAVVVAPWTLRNHEVFGRWFPVAATLGENAYRGIYGPYQSFDYPPAVTNRHPGFAAPLKASGAAASKPPSTAAAGEEGPGDGAVEADEMGYYAWLYGADHWVYRWFIARRPEAEWARGFNLNVIDHSRNNAHRAVEFARQHPGYFALGRIKRLANWISPTSFLVRHYGLERYHGVLNATAVRRAIVLGAVLLSVLVIGAAGGGVCLPARDGAAIAALRWTLLYFLAPALLAGMSRHRTAVEPLLIAAAGAFLASALRRQWPSGRRWLVMTLLWAVLAFLWLLAAYEVIGVLRIVW